MEQREGIDLIIVSTAFEYAIAGKDPCPCLEIVHYGKQYVLCPPLRAYECIADDADRPGPREPPVHEEVDERHKACVVLFRLLATAFDRDRCVPNISRESQPDIESFPRNELSAPGEAIGVKAEGGVEVRVCREGRSIETDVSAYTAMGIHAERRDDDAEIVSVLMYVTCLDSSRVRSISIQVVGEGELRPAIPWNADVVLFREDCGALDVQDIFGPSFGNEQCGAEYQ